jgi:acyl-CoA synthetase (AMP-forming)/AMP-acid ligase II
MRIVAGVRAADTTVTNLYGVDGLSSARTPSRSENVRSALAGTSADCRRTGKRSLASRRQRWGSEVVAVVALVEGTTTTADELIQHAGKTLARYKLPKAVVFRSEIARSPSGKADYRWAREQANDANAAAS